ncbi:hypothetical protein P7K49_023262 [Saguinus oedipus]|uniref:SGF29 C-terminal domain-containing protein n=1 Tax=Saguinus oedipus TaxID=9490 RepID=A0ABQ9UL90_SAGOE|nr:hypothetical protein P7K49_023262 [Saguinus oedipus]
MGPERYSQVSQAPSRLDPECQDEDSVAQAWLIQLGTLFPELDQAGTRGLHSPRHRPSRGRSCPGSSQRNSSARQITWALGGQPGSGQHKGPCSSSPRQQAAIDFAGFWQFSTRIGVGETNEINKTRSKSDNNAGAQASGVPGPAQAQARGPQRDLRGALGQGRPEGQRPLLHSGQSSRRRSGRCGSGRSAQGGGDGSTTTPARHGGAKTASGRGRTPKPRTLAATRSPSLPEWRPRRMGNRAEHAPSPWGGERGCPFEPLCAPSRVPSNSTQERGPHPWLQPSPRPRPCLQPRPLHLPISDSSSSLGIRLSPLLSSCAPPNPSVPTRTPTLDPSLDHHPRPSQLLPEFHHQDSQGTAYPSRSSPGTGPVPALETPPASQAWQVPLIRPVPSAVRLLQEAFLPAETLLLSTAAPVGHLADGATVLLGPRAHSGARALRGSSNSSVQQARASFLPTAAKILSVYSEPPRKTMRRGVLMTLLQQSAMTLPLWIGKPGDKPPPLCGAIPASGDYVARPGDRVAARVKAVDGDEQWILAKVVSYSHTTDRYEVDDIDEEGKGELQVLHLH